MNLFFIPGGPGLNSNPEKNLLGTYFCSDFSSMMFFNEPSKQRPEGPVVNEENGFKGYLKALDEEFEEFNESDILLVAHSFGVHGALYLAKKYKRRIRKIVLLAPCLDFLSSDRKRFEFMKNDFISTEGESSENARELDLIISSLSGSLDQNLLDGFSIIASNPRLFRYYFANKGAMAKTLSFYMEEGFQFDFSSFVEIRKTFKPMSLDAKIDVPLDVVFGAHDPLIDKEIETTLLSRYFCNMTLNTFSNVAHFPHLEDMEGISSLLGIQSNTELTESYR